MKVEAPALRFLPEAPKNGYELWTVAIDGRGDFDRGTLACREGAFTEIFLPWPSVDGMGRVLPNLAAIEVFAAAQTAALLKSSKERPRPAGGLRSGLQS